MHNVNTTGYTRGTSSEKNGYNIIPSSLITMENVDKPLMLIPIINGKPDHSKRVLAKPGDADIDFGKDVSGVLEIPYAQSAYGFIGNNPLKNFGMGTNYNFNPNPPIDDSLAGSPLYGDQFMSNQLPNVQPQEVNFNSSLYNTPSGEQKTELDANVRQNLQGLQTQTKIQQAMNDDQNGNPFVGAANPYGGWNMQNASTMLGASIEDGNTLGIIGGAGKILLEGFRNAASGAAAMKKYRNNYNSYMDKMERQERRAGLFSNGNFQKGGKITDGKLLTGNYLMGNEEHPEPNAEVERGEYLQTPDGNAMEVMGKRHSEGGELVSMPENTKVVSDYLKIGRELAQYFKKNYGLNVTAGSTYATVLDKYKNKIGLSEILDEESKLMKKIVDQDDVKFESTRDINLEILSKKVNELQPEKEPLENQFNEFYNLVFEKQEQNKEDGGTHYEKQEGGNIDQDGQQAQMMNAIQQYAEANGQDPEQLIGQIQSLSPEEQEQALSQIMGGGQPEQPQEGDDGMMQMIEAYAQMTNQNPQDIIAQLQQMDDEQLQQAIQEITQAVNQSVGDQPQPEAEAPEQSPEMAEGGLIKYQYGGLNKVDSGYIDTTANFDWKDYSPVVIKLGKSLLGGKDEAGKTYNPGSLENVQDFMKDAESLIKMNPKYKDDYEKLAKEIGNAKTDAGRFNILNSKGQKIRQKAFLDVAPNSLKTYVGMGYAPTQTQLQNVYNSLNTDKEKENFSKVLIDNGWGINKGKVLGGNFKYRDDYNEDNTLYKYIDGLSKKNPDLYNKLAVDNISDGVWDRRRENFREMSFKSVADRDAYFKERGFANKDGFWVDPKNRNNIIIPKVYRDKVVSQEEMDKFGKFANADIEGYKDVGTPGVFEKWTTNTPTKPTESGQPTQTNELGAYDPRGLQEFTGLPMLTPDQSNLPPNYLPTTMRQVGSTQANRVSISPEENIKELNRQANTASNLITETNPYTAGAGLANLQAQTNNSINQAISQAAIANQQDERNVDNINEQRIMDRDRTNLGLADKYERESIVGLDNLYGEWRNYIDNVNRQNVSNWNLQNLQNAFNAINPNYKIGMNGEIIQTNEPFRVYLDNGEYGTYYPKTKQVVTSTTKSPDGRTSQKVQTTRGPQKRKGGSIVTENLLKFFK